MREDLPTRAEPRQATKSERLLRWIERCFAVVGVLLSIWLLCFDLLDAASDSMAPTLHAADVGGDVVLVERLSRRWRLPRRGELITFLRSDGLSRSLLIKRVAALPGETLQIRKGALVIDGKALTTEPFIGRRYFPNRKALKEAGVTVKSGLFVLGDNPRKSWDSRFFGEVAPAAVRGRALCVVWPPSRWRWL